MAGSRDAFQANAPTDPIATSDSTIAVAGVRMLAQRRAATIMPTMLSASVASAPKTDHVNRLKVRASPSHPR